MVQKVTYRETSGILIAAICVLSFIGIGFAQVAVFVLTGKMISFPPDWQAAMLSISSAALGFLLGNQSDNRPGATKQQPTASITTTETVTATQGYAIPQGSANVAPPDESSSGTK